MKDLGGKGKFANMPQEVMMKEYPKCDYVRSDLDDTMTNIDMVKDKSVKKAKKYVSNQK